MALTPTSLDEELDFQSRWELLPRWQGVRWFDDLIQNEFRPADQVQLQLVQAIREVVSRAIDTVPYYRERFSSVALKPSDIHTVDDLVRFPVLNRHQVLEHFESLQPITKLPREDLPLSVCQTSGSTGLPVRVVHSRGSRDRFSVLWQRQPRWFRHDINGRFARIRLARDLARLPNRSLNPDGNTIRRPRWTYTGMFFRTGDEVQFNVSNTREDQLRWINEHRPNYIMTFPGLMEELALATDCRPLPHAVRGLIGISSLMTDSMRHLVESAFRIPVDQNYGLNEVGLVAVRCAAGRYHVHVEHACVEIVDQEGRAVRPGETGRLLVTAFQNRVMPLIRYDSGDLATASRGPCPCGRTLPTFQDIQGRYRRFAHVPDGTRQRVNGLLAAIEKAPAKLLKNLRQYQIFQCADYCFQLRVKSVGPLARGFQLAVEAAWDAANNDGRDWPLSIVEVGEIPRSSTGKLLDFDSEFYPDDDSIAKAHSDSETDIST
jgi:phenylacetate-CoA ligase